MRICSFPPNIFYRNDGIPESAKEKASIVIVATLEFNHDYPSINVTRIIIGLGSENMRGYG